MNVSAIDRISPVHVNAVRDPYIAGLLGAQNRVDRFSRAQPVQSARIQALREQAAASAAASVAASSAAGSAASLAAIAQHPATLAQHPAVADKCDPAERANCLCDQYASERVSRAVQAFIDEQEALRARANGVPNLGTLEGLYPFQRYFMAFANPPVELQQAAGAASVLPTMVGPIANVAAARNTTEDALGSDGTTRALVRSRRPRTMGA
ncbi:hypothetical protein [Bordetella sp. LUAb4]|uniref:hypothetical protein n=1 Tax=Bordetella sp. LUAb4 TaxID=2843195 RepID=UPI001E2D4303|nr:hypothetical protein [Bordetella sp. LUAb4]